MQTVDAPPDTESGTAITISAHGVKMSYLIPLRYASDIIQGLKTKSI